jgi:hypothetical protein
MKSAIMNAFMDHKTIAESEHIDALIFDDSVNHFIGMKAFTQYANLMAELYSKTTGKFNKEHPEFVLSADECPFTVRATIDGYRTELRPDWQNHYPTIRRLEEVAVNMFLKILVNFNY